MKVRSSRYTDQFNACVTWSTITLSSSFLISLGIPVLTLFAAQWLRQCHRMFSSNYHLGYNTFITAGLQVLVQKRVITPQHTVLDIAAVVTVRKVKRIEMNFTFTYTHTHTHTHMQQNVHQVYSRVYAS